MLVWVLAPIQQLGCGIRGCATAPGRSCAGRDDDQAPARATAGLHLGQGAKPARSGTVSVLRAAQIQGRLMEGAG